METEKTQKVLVAGYAEAWQNMDRIMGYIDGLDANLYNVFKEPQQPADLREELIAYAEYVVSKKIIKNEKGEVLYSSNLPTLKKAVEMAVRTKVDLTGAQLENTDLSYTDLIGAKLQNANLMEANLEGAELDKANLQGANLRFANMHRARFHKTNLSGADITHATVDLHCNILNVKTDESLRTQVAFLLVKWLESDPNISSEEQNILDLLQPYTQKAKAENEF